MEIKEKLAKVFEKKVKGKSFTLDTKLEELGLDSLDKIELLYDIEDEFGIEFENEEMQAFASVGDVYKSIEAKVSK